MEKRLSTVLFANIFFLAVSMIVLQVAVTQHEEAHYQIFDYYGCENISMSVRPWGGTTSCDDINPVFLNKMAMIGKHADNEILGYHTFAAIFTALVFLGYFMIWREFHVNKL